MGPELVTVDAGGQRWTAFTSVSADAAIDEAARSFRLEIAAEVGAAATAWAFKAGTRVEIRANGDLVCIGHVDRYQPRISKDTATVTVTGRSLAADVVDSAAVDPTGRFENKTVADIGNALGKAHGITFRAVGTLKPIKIAQVTPGETVFQVVERLARQQNLTLAGDADGNVTLYSPEKAERHAGMIAQGQNLLEGSADHNWSGRFSEYRVLGQAPLGTGPDALEVEAIARDSGVSRQRTLVIVERTDIDKERAKGRAKARRDRAAGKSLSAQVSLQGWRDEGGQLWTPGRKVFLLSDFLRVSQDMLVERVAWSQDGNGSISQLTLVDPRAYGGKAGKTAKSDGSWKQDDSDAE